MKVTIRRDCVWVDGSPVADVFGDLMRINPEKIHVVNNSAIHARTLIWRASHKIIAVLDTKENEFLEPQEFKSKYNVMGLTYKITEMHVIKSLD